MVARNNLSDFFKKEGTWFFILVLFAVFLRFFSFFPSELDHDESTYAIIGNSILNGKQLYSDVTDTKPVGIFLVYAALQYLFGYSIFMKRLFVAVLVGVSAFLVRKVSKHLFNDRKAANAAALIYIFYTSIWTYFGLSPNTELYFNFFTIASLLLFIRDKKTSLLFAGLLAGIGFMFKYLVLLDFAAFMLFFFFKDILEKGFGIKLLLRYFMSGIAFLIPFGLTALYFKLQGRFDDFVFISFIVPQNYGSSSALLNYIVMLGDLLIRFFPITFFIVIGIIKGRKFIANKWQLFFLFWVCAVLIAMYLPGKGLSHYSVQLILPLSFIAGLYFHDSLKVNRISNFLFRGKSGAVVLLVIVIALQVISFSENYIENDLQLEIVEYIEPRIDDDDFVFVGNYEQVLYYLMHKEPPSKYVHSNIIFTDLHTAFEFDNVAEINRIMNLQPTYVMLQHDNKILQPIIDQEYRLDTVFNNKVRLYRHIDE